MKFSNSNRRSRKANRSQDNFGLTEKEFDKMVGQLQKGDETLFEHIFLAQFSSTVDYLRNRFKIEQEIAHDIVMDTLIEFRIKLVDKKIKYGNLRFLFSRMASHNLIDKHKKELKVKEAIQVFTEGKDDQVQNADVFFDVLDKSIAELLESERKLIYEHYHLGIKVRELANQYNIPYETIRKRKQRVFKKIELTFFEILQKLKENNE